MIARSLKLALNYESYQSGQRCRRILDVRHWTEHKTRLCRAWAGLARRCRLPSQAGASRGRLESRGAATRNAVPSTCFSASASPVNHHRRYTAGFLSFSFSPLGWHMLLSHASAEACLTGWPNAQLQGKDWCSVARHHHHQANLMVCVVCSCCTTSPYREVCRAKGRDREWRDLVPYLPCSAYNHCFSAFSGG